MEVTRTFEYKNTILQLASFKTPFPYKNENTSNLVKRFSTLDMAARPLPKIARTEHYYAKTGNHQRNVQSINGPKRPTRCSLPKHATNILKDWLFINWHDPYPTEQEKDRLSITTGLKLGQVNNWLINARRRYLPVICRKYGLDYSKCKIAKRGSGLDKAVVLGGESKIPAEQVVPDSYAEWRASPSPELDRFSLAFPGSEVEVPSPDVTYSVVLKVPDSPEHQPVMLDYLADVMLVNEELEKQPNEEGLSRQELLCQRGLGERFYPCSS